MERVRKQSKLKWFLWSLLIELIAGAILLATFMFGSLFTTRADENGLVEIHPKFTLGALDGNGKYQKDVGAIYTKEAFECKGLKIVLDFEDTIFYNICYYKNDGTFICESFLNDENLTPVIPEEATHARIVIIPEWEKLRIFDEREQVIKWYEVEKYASQMQIFVLENQSETKEDNNSNNDIQFVGAFDKVSLYDEAYVDDIYYGEYFDYGIQIDTGDEFGEGLRTYRVIVCDTYEFYIESEEEVIWYAVVRIGNSEYDTPFYEKGEVYDGYSAEHPILVKAGDIMYITVVETNPELTHLYVRYK